MEVGNKVATKPSIFEGIDDILDEIKFHLKLSCRVHKCSAKELTPFSLDVAVRTALKGYIEARNDKECKQ